MREWVHRCGKFIWGYSVLLGGMQGYAQSDSNQYTPVIEDFKGGNHGNRLISPFLEKQFANITWERKASIFMTSENPLSTKVVTHDRAVSTLTLNFKQKNETDEFWEGTLLEQFPITNPPLENKSSVIEANLGFSESSISFQVIEFTSRLKGGTAQRSIENYQCVPLCPREESHTDHEKDYPNELLCKIINPARPKTGVWYLFQRIGTS